MQALTQLTDAARQYPPVVLAVGMGFGVLLFAGLALDLVLLLLHRRRPLRAPALVARQTARPWTWQDAAFILLTLATLHGGTQLAVNIGLWTGALDPGDKPLTYTMMVIQTFTFQVVALTAVVWLMRLRGWTWKESFGTEGHHTARHVGTGLVAYAAMLPPVLIIGLSYALMLKSLGFDLGRQDVIQILLDPALPAPVRVAFFFLGIVTAPVVEELVFRGVALPVAVRHLGVVPAILLVSLLFAAIHWHGPSLAPLFVLAVALSVAYHYTGSILVPITMHLIFNSVNLVLIMILSRYPELDQSLGILQGVRCSVFGVQ